MFKEAKGTVFLLMGAFFLVLLLNTYFNYTSGITINEEGTSLSDKFYLAGPDPYYNARLIEETIESGGYPYLGGLHGGEDPLLNYPVGRSGGRPPLFNMITVGVGISLSPFMGLTDALGYAMQFLPALYGALLVVPVYITGATLFNKKAGIIGAFIVSLIPIHLASGHGSAYSLYDHDSLVLLLTATTIMFLLLALKEKNTRKSVLYSMMSGIGVASISMTWVAAQYIYAILAVYAIAQMLVDIITSRINLKTPILMLTTLFFGYLLSFPMYWVKYGFSLTVPLSIALGVALFSIIYITLGKKNIPWVLSLPVISGVGAAGALFLYVIRNSTNTFLKPLTRISDVIFGAGIYGKKVSLTIAEAGTFDFSRNVMSFGPVLYFLAWFGLLFLLRHYYKNKYKREYFLLIIWFLAEAYLVTTAGRFLNNLVPLVAIFSGWMIWWVVEKIDFPSMIKTIKGVGGGWYGVKKGVKIRHIAGAVFIVLFIMMPNAWMAFDAALPGTMKQKFGTSPGAFGLGVRTEEYWTDAFSWLKEETGNMNDSEKPAFVAWWDYGFYCVAMAENPTVADNFQDGIPPASNFHTSTNEKEAVAIFIIRLAEGDMKENDGKLSQGVIDVFDKYLGSNSSDLINILENPVAYAPSYTTLVSPEYQKDKHKVPSPELWPVRIREENAKYQDAINILASLSDEKITWFYHGMQNETGHSIRYYGVEGYDLNIFNVFTFLADKGLFGYATTEDDYFRIWYEAENGVEYEPHELTNMTPEERENIGALSTEQENKQAFFETMVYKTYVGMSVSKEDFEWGLDQYNYNPYLPQIISPTIGLKHFVAEYISPDHIYQPRPGWLCTGCPAVVIAKYYEGAQLSGMIQSKGEVLDNARIEVQKNITLFNISRGIAHDSNITDKDGYFTLIAPAGNISLSIIIGGVEVKRVTFNGAGLFSPITDDEAMRRSPAWKRDLGTIEVERASINGIVYWDKDGDEVYNESKDSLLSNAVVKAGEKEVRTNAKGQYEFKNIMPGSYDITIEKKGYELTSGVSVSLKEGDIKRNNISMVPSEVEVTGITWYDENGNGRRDINEAMSSVQTLFTVISAPDENAQNNSAASNSTGFYAVSLSPGTYAVEVNHTKTVENESVRFVYTDEIEIKIGSASKTYNINLKVAKD
jgi:dolichyl-diphosphooligosaccharide--protein glycosyltransferase